MQAEITWLDDPEVFRVNQLPAHSDHPFYADEEECRRGNSSLCHSDRKSTRLNSSHIH